MERDLNMSLQYSRRDTIEITGIPPVIEDQDLEKEVIDIFRDVKVCGWQAADQSKWHPSLSQIE